MARERRDDRMNIWHFAKWKPTRIVFRQGDDFRTVSRCPVFTQRGGRNLGVLAGQDG